MEGNYEVFLNGNSVGQAEVIREGLYYRFRCRCDLSGDVCKLMVTCGNHQENLGVLVPGKGGFALETKLPIKRFSGEKPEFIVVPNRAVLTGKFVPIYPEEPFAYIEKLKNAYFIRRNGQAGVIIQEKAGT